MSAVSLKLAGPTDHRPGATVGAMQRSATGRATIPPPAVHWPNAGADTRKR
jgi:hypothetical protein